MSAHNFSTVLSFELRRTLLRPIYWLTTLSVPALMAIIVALSFFSGSTAADRAQSAGDRVSFQYVDASGIVAADVATRLGGTPATDPAAAEGAVQQGTLDAFVSVPADPVTDPVRIVARDEGLLNSNQWYSLARQLVSDSAAQRLGDDRLVELTRGVPMTLETWKDGRPSAGLGGAVMPAFFLILLYAAILMLGQQMLNITVEEKENRVTEMILTTIRPRVLILAKITAVIVAGLVQAAVFLVPALIWLGTTGGQLATSESSTPLGLSEIVVDPGSLALSALLFVGGFGMFTALLVVIGSVAPTVKDASSAFGGLVLAMFIPLYVTPLVASEPDSLITQAVTYFPLTAPIATQMRNATGTLSVPEGLAALVIVYATTGVLLWAAVRLFGAGSISYDTRLRLSALRRPRAAA